MELPINEGSINNPYLLGEGNRYTILPLDEEHFEIDANSRMIKIPDAFKKNGIAVQGDQVAEVVYFRINRYFDFMDLNETQIFIQWSAQTENGGTVSGISNDWVRDIESDPDYLIFGWALDSDITKYTGTLKFSVRFVKINDGTDSELPSPTELPFLYSFSTLDASATINKALNLDYDFLTNPDYIKRLEKIKNMMTKRVTATPILDANIIPELPEYITNLIEWVYYKNYNVLPELDSAQKQYIYQVDLDSETKEYQFAVYAYSTDAGDVQYQYYQDNKEVKGNDFYVKIEDKTKCAEGEIYYTKTTENVMDPNTQEVIRKDKYTIAEDIGPGDSLLDGEGRRRDLYEKFYGYVAKAAGHYIVKAYNVIEGVESGMVSGNIIPGTESNETPTIKEIVIPGPSRKNVNIKPKQTTLDPTTGTIEINGEYTIQEEQEYVDESQEVISYQWYHNNEKIGDANDINYKTPDNSQFLSKDQGYYQLEVSSKRNEVTQSDLSKAALITYIAEKPGLILKYTDTDGKEQIIQDFSGVGANIYTQIPYGTTVHAEVSYTEGYHINDLLGQPLQETTYQWYADDGKDNTTDDIPNQSSKFVAPREGQASDYIGKKIYCIVTNKYNGSVSATTSPKFTIGI